MPAETAGPEPELTEAAAAAPVPPPPHELMLELGLHHDDAARLSRLPEIGRSRQPARAAAFSLIWHDTPDSALMRAGLALAEQRIGRASAWQLTKMRPDPDDIWPPGTLAPLLAEAPDRAALEGVTAGPLVPVAGVEGRRRALTMTTPDGAVELVVMQGVLRAVAGEQPSCRVVLTGPATAVMAASRVLAAALRVFVPATALSADAYAVARLPPPPRHLGAPALPAGVAVGEAFAHLAAHLTDVILHYAPRALAGEAPEPVHQMRVALRRLKSAIGLFRKAVQCPELDRASAELKALAAVLGPARDWDVFTAGTAAAVHRAFEGDPAITRLVAAAHRQRAASYEALRLYLESVAFRQLGLTLAALAATRPWAKAEITADAPAGSPPAHDAAPDQPMTQYAAHALTRRLRAVLAPGKDISHLPAEALHDIRLACKRLRYAAEFFAPLFPGRNTRRFIQRLSALQEQLGLMNDTDVASGLLGQLGAARGYAAGAVRGFIAAGHTGSRAEIMRAWKKLRRQNAFWR